MCISIRQFFTLFLITVNNWFLSAQQVPDTNYQPKFPELYFNSTLKIFVDEAHHNFHTASDRYSPFAKLLTTHGYNVASANSEFSRTHLEKIDVLIIANAIHQSNNANWNLPNPSAFANEEISIVQDWVKNGGRLFLIADHMPFSGAASDLAKAFGFTFYNGFLVDTLNRMNGDLFCKAKNNLSTHQLTESVDSVYSFTGQAFDIPSNAQSIINCDKRFVLFMPDRAWEFTHSTRRISANDKVQLAILDYGKGKIIVSGEAAMFTAQIANGHKVGMNSLHAKNNAKLLLRLMNWLCT